MPYIDVADKTTLDTVNSNVNTINGTKIGATDDSGATSSSGSVMGKLNKIMGDIGSSIVYERGGNLII